MRSRQTQHAYSVKYRQALEIKKRRYQLESRKQKSNGVILGVRVTLLSNYTLYIRYISSNSNVTYQWTPQFHRFWDASPHIATPSNTVLILETHIPRLPRSQKNACRKKVACPLVNCPSKKQPLLHSDHTGIKFWAWRGTVELNIVRIKFL